jgi:hypothetical protein
MSRHRISKRRLTEMTEEATVDCYNDSEKITGWFTMIEDNLFVPFGTTMVGVPVTVEKVNLTSADQIIVQCARGAHRLAISSSIFQFLIRRRTAGSGSRRIGYGTPRPARRSLSRNDGLRACSVRKASSWRSKFGSPPCELVGPPIREVEEGVEVLLHPRLDIPFEVTPLIVVHQARRGDAGAAREGSQGGHLPGAESAIADLELVVPGTRSSLGSEC